MGAFNFCVAEAFITKEVLSARIVLLKTAVIKHPREDGEKYQKVIFVLVCTLGWCRPSLCSLIVTVKFMTAWRNLCHAKRYFVYVSVCSVDYA